MYIKYCILLSFIGLLAACKPSFSDSSETLQKLSHPYDQWRFADSRTAGAICPQGDNFCSDYAEQALLAKYPKIIQRSKDVLSIKLYDGTTKIFKPEKGTENEECGVCSYEVVNEYPLIDSILISRGYYEGGDYLLFNLKTGEALELSGLPIFSTDFKFMLSINSDIEAGYTANAFEIYQLNANAKPKLLLDAVKKVSRFTEDKNVGFSEAIWLSPSSILFQTDQISHDHSNIENNYFLFEQVDPQDITRWKVKEIDNAMYYELQSKFRDDAIKK